MLIVTITKWGIAQCSNMAHGPFWGILAKGCGSMDQVQPSLYKNDQKQIFPSLVQASYNRRQK